MIGGNNFAVETPRRPDGQVGIDNETEGINNKIMAVGRPTCLSILLCDSIYRDDRTKKLIIVGTFNTVFGRALPIPISRMCVLFTLTGAHGTYDMSLSVEEEKTGQHVAELRGPFEAKDPLRIADFNVQFGGLRFPNPGKYWIVLKVDGEIIAQRPIFAQLVEAEKETKDA